LIEDGNQQSSSSQTPNVNSAGHYEGQHSPNQHPPVNYKRRVVLIIAFLIALEEEVEVFLAMGHMGQKLT
jgi:hypothetical protein